MLAACDFPSEAPILQQTWVVPGDSVAVNVAQILPNNISMAAGGGAFVVTVPLPAAFSTTLGALCAQPACQSGATVSAPVPAFTSSGATLTRTVTFPATVASATVTGGTVTLLVNNNLGFDPLRPNGASPAYGTMTVTITNGATNTATNFNGATQAMPNGAVTNLSVPVPAGTYATSFSVSIAFNVPASSGNYSLAASNSISVTPSVDNLTVSQASVVVVNESINTTPSSFDMDDVDFADQVEGGGLILDVVNPFTASATGSLVVAAPAQGADPAVNISKPFNIAATPTSTVSITLSKAELQSLVGKTGVTMSVTGNATGTGAGNTVTVTPTSRITLRTKVQLILNVGG